MLKFPDDAQSCEFEFRDGLAGKQLWHVGVEKASSMQSLRYGRLTPGMDQRTPAPGLAPPELSWGQRVHFSVSYTRPSYWRPVKHTDVWLERTATGFIRVPGP